MAIMKIFLIVLLSVLPFINGNEYDLRNAKLSKPSNGIGDYGMRTLIRIPNPHHPNNPSRDFELRCFGVNIANDLKLCMTKMTATATQ